MKKFMKSAGWQIGAFVLAIGAAFATNAMKDTTMFPFEPGYQRLNVEATNCQVRIMCDTQNTGVLCTWTVGSTIHNLYGLVNEGGVTKCTKPLYKIGGAD